MGSSFHSFHSLSPATGPGFMGSLISLDMLQDDKERGVFASVSLFKNLSDNSSEVTEVASFHSVDEMTPRLMKAALLVVKGNAWGRRIDGDLHENVKGELGSRKYLEICSSSVLEEICYCQSGLSSLTGSVNPVLNSADRSRLLSDKVRKLINHDFLVLTFTHGDISAPKLHIRSEKIGSPPEKAGIVTSVDRTFEENAEAVKLFFIDCGKKRINLEVVLKSLANHDLHYVLNENNCWQYAREAAKEVLVECQKLPGVSLHEIQRLKKEAASIEANVAKKFLGHLGHAAMDGFKRIIQSAAS